MFLRNTQLLPYILQSKILKLCLSNKFKIFNFFLLFVMFLDIPVETLSLLILPHLFQPCQIKTNKKKWKPSKIEVAESFIYRVPVSNSNTNINFNY